MKRTLIDHEDENESKKNKKKDLRTQPHHISEDMKALGLEPFVEMVLYGAAIE